MNQSILFPDIQRYQAQRKAVEFPAQISGCLLHCYISVVWLEKRSGSPLLEEDEILDAFSSLRFDLEELAEGFIEDEAYDQQGHLVLDEYL